MTEENTVFNKDIENIFIDINAYIVTEIIEAIKEDITYNFITNSKYLWKESGEEWDISGYLTNTYKKLKLSDYHKLNDFLEEYTGDSEATYISGMGLSYPTYGERYGFSFINDYLPGLLEPYFENIFGYKKDTDEYFDIYYENEDQITELSMNINQYIDEEMDLLKEKTFISVISPYVSQIKKEILQKEIQHEEYCKEREILEKKSDKIMSYIHLYVKNNNILLPVPEASNYCITTNTGTEKNTDYHNLENFKIHRQNSSFFIQILKNIQIEYKLDNKDIQLLADFHQRHFSNAVVADIRNF
jgi:hypothetical protein